ncbi:MFS transporter [Mucilaginibacter sp. HMF5004]|uniref:MFS transporter n=1 Tax=Mucilaginibacter rivuli TaxID=2857527 RepID=UPI001C5F8272|nr:MFS transporter [Mucilaginibacter rivuli]MBW4889283.1 MFS transporter [Mucilaginibacter rivuli]
MLINLYKQAYSGLSRDSWYLCAVMFVNRCGTMVLPFMTIYCTQKLHFNIAQAGSIMAIYGLGAVLGAFIGGRVTDKFGFYDLQVFALLSGGLLFMLLGFQTTFLAIAINTFILSMCNESFRPANSAAVAEYSTEETRTRSFSLNRLAVNLGWAFGSGFGGLIAAVNYHLLFWVDGCTNILAAIMLLKLIPRTKFVSPKAIGKAEKKASSAYRDHVYLMFIGLSVLFGMCFFQIFAMQPVFYKTQWHLTEAYIGLTMTVSGLIITFTEMLIVNKLEGKRHQLQYAAIGAVVIGFAFSIVNILPAGAVVAMLVAVLLTVGEMIAMPFMSSFWILRTTDYNRGQYAALYTMSWSAAQVLGPYLGGLAIGYVGFVAFWWMVGSICVLTALGFICLYWFTYSSKTNSYVV